jgi:dTDP-L-rhamnose 4-epimerase
MLKVPPAAAGCSRASAKARETLGFEARQDFGEGLADLAAWLSGQTAEDRAESAREELEARGLVA